MTFAGPKARGRNHTWRPVTAQGESTMTPASASGRRAFALLSASFLSLAAAGPAAGLVVDFEDVGAGLPAPPPGGFYDGSDGAGGFASGGVHFANLFQDFGGGFTSWAGFAYANVVDATTPGFGNQYAAYPGGGAGPGGSDPGGTYAVAFEDSFTPFPPRITFASDERPETVKIANTTYAALAVRDGDAFSKRFGGPTGTDPDWFRLTITGLDAAGTETGSVDVYLADYRFADDALDYVLAEWLTVDLSGLGPVRSLVFGLSSSDMGDFGMNTPAYFALDDLVVAPEPSAASLLALGLAVLARSRRRAA